MATSTKRRRVHVPKRVKVTNRPPKGKGARTVNPKSLTKPARIR